MKINDFIEEIEKLGINLTDNQLKKLEEYYKLIIDWNTKINLTTITKKEDVYLKHFYDSLTLFKAIDLNQNLKVIDIGTGAGFPGIVLKICFPNLNITLIDSLEKRVKFLNIVIEKLNLKDIVAIHERAELFAISNREKYDLCVSRAVAKLNILCELSIPMLKINGYFIAMKGIIDDELNNSSSAIKTLNGELTNLFSFNLPYENSVRNLVKIQKRGITNIKFPRKFDKIKKNPL